MRRWLAPPVAIKILPTRLSADYEAKQRFDRFSSFRANVNVVQLNLDEKGQQNAKLLIADAARDQFGPAYSPDGKHLAYFSNFKGVEREGIWLASPDGSNPVSLVQDQRINIFPRWTRDSKYLVYASYPSGSLKGSPGTEYRRISISGGNTADFAE